MSDPIPDRGAPRRRSLRAAPVAAALLAACVAALVLWPRLRFAADAQGPSGGVPFFGVKDGEYYVAQVRHVLDGTYGFANDLLAEWSVGEQAPPPWTYWLAAQWARALGGELHLALDLLAALGGAAQFLVLAAVARTLGASRPASLAAASLACLAPFLWGYLGAELWLGAPERVTTGFLPLSRPVNPSISSLVLWLMLLALLRWARRPTLRGWLAVTLTLAAAWSAYPPLFAMGGALVAGAALAAALDRKWARAGSALAAGLAAAAANAPSILRTMAAPADPETLAGNMLALPDRTPVLTANLVTAAVLGAIGRAVVGRYARNARRAAVVGFPVALAIVFNQHLLTGRLDQPFHYDWFWSVPLVWLLSTVLCARSAALVRRVRRGTLARAGLGAVPAACAGIGAVWTLLAFGGTVTAPVLRAVGVIRADTVERPWVVWAAAVVPLAVVALSARLLARGRTRAFRGVAAAVVAAGAVALGTHLQEHEYARRRGQCVEAQRLGPALRWLRNNAGAGDVVACATDLAARLVPSHTGRNVLVSAEVQFGASVPPESEFRRRRYVQFALFGLAPEELAAGLHDGGRWQSAVFKWRTFGPPPRAVAVLSHGRHHAPLAPGADARAVREYSDVLALPPERRLREFRVDWVLWSADGLRLGLADPAGHPGLALAAEWDGVRLYRAER